MAFFAIFANSSDFLTTSNMSASEFLRSHLFRNHFLISVGLTLILILISFFSLRLITHHNETIVLPDLKGKSIEEVKSSLDELDLQFEIIDSVFVSQVDKGAVYEQIPPAGTLVKSARTILLITNATGKEKVSMPYLLGVSLRQAQTILLSTGLRVGTLKYVPDIAVNNVLKQLYLGNEIKAGVSIEKNAVIDLVLGKGLSSEKTRVPYLIGLNFETAKDRITNRFLNIGAAIFDESIQSSQDSAEAIIWKQIPSLIRDETLFLGSPIDVWLTRMPEKIVVDSLLFNLPDSIQLAPQ
jgi:beta-lactam-binding protein with PASTA domain